MNLSEARRQKDVRQNGSEQKCEGDPVPSRCSSPERQMAAYTDPLALCMNVQAEKILKNFIRSGEFRAVTVITSEPAAPNRLALKRTTTSSGSWFFGCHRLHGSL